MDKKLLLAKLKELNRALSDVHDVLQRMEYFVETLGSRR